MSAIVIDIAIGCLEEIGRLELIGGNLHQLIVILAKHDEIYVIVPRDETSLANSSEQGAAIHPALQTVTLANVDKAFGHIHTYGPHLLHLVAYGIALPCFLLQEVIW